MTAARVPAYDEVEKGTELRQMTGHPSQLYGLAVSGDGKTAVSCCSAGAG